MPVLWGEFAGGGKIRILRINRRRKGKKSTSSGALPRDQIKEQTLSSFCEKTSLWQRKGILGKKGVKRKSSHVEFVLGSGEGGKRGDGRLFAKSGS